MKLASDTAETTRAATPRKERRSACRTYPIINRQTGSGPFCGNAFPSGGIYDPNGNSVTSPSTCAGATTPTVSARTPAVNATAGRGR